MGLSKVSKVIGLPVLIAVIGASAISSNMTAVAADSFISVSETSPVLKVQKPEERKQEILDSFTEDFESEVAGRLEAIVSEREAVGLSNEALTELEEQLSQMRFSEGFAYFTSQIFFEKEYVEDLEDSFAKQVETADGIVEEWKAELEAEKEREAERERIRKEEEARKAAEAAAAAAYSQPSNGAQAPSQASGGGGAAAPAESGYTVRIGGAGGQGLIDACVGAVWWSGWHNLLAEHWHCGGASFPQWAGAIIHIPGSGTYQSAGVVSVVNQATANTGNIPGGYDVVYQTCLNNNPGTTGLIGLTRIG